MSSSTAKKATKKKKTTAKKKAPAKNKAVKKKAAAPKKKVASAKKKAAPKAKAAPKKNAVAPQKTAPAKVQPAAAPAKPVSLGSNGKPSAAKITEYLTSTVGETHALLLLSGGVVSAALAVLAHKALGGKAKIYLLDTGLMRQDMSKETFLLFKKLGITVNIVNARKEFTAALKDKQDPGRKRDGIHQAFYNDMLRELSKQARAKFLINCVCADTVDIIGAAALQDVFKVSNMKPERPFGCTVLEPLAGFKRDAVAKLAKELKLPAAVYNAEPFSVYGLAGRVAGEANTEKVEIARRATALVDGVMGNSNAVKVIPIVHQELFPTMVNGKSGEGYQVELRCWETKGGKVVMPYRLAPKQLDAITKKITSGIPSVVCISLNLTPQPPVAETLI